MALIDAALSGNAERDKALIFAGANVHMKAYTGDTALTMAKSDEIKTMLRAAGEKEWNSLNVKLDVDYGVN